MKELDVNSLLDIIDPRGLLERKAENLEPFRHLKMLIERGERVSDTATLSVIYSIADGIFLFENHEDLVDVATKHVSTVYNGKNSYRKMAMLRKAMDNVAFHKEKVGNAVPFNLIAKITKNKEAPVIMLSPRGINEFLHRLRKYRNFVSKFEAVVDWNSVFYDLLSSRDDSITIKKAIYVDFGDLSIVDNKEINWDDFLLALSEYDANYVFSDAGDIHRKQRNAHMKIEAAASVNDDAYEALDIYLSTKDFNKALSWLINNNVLPKTSKFYTTA